LPYTLTASETGQPAGTSFTYRIDWDGNGTVDQTLSGASGLVVNRVYPASGNYTIKVTALDAAGNVTPQTATQAVVIKQVALEVDPADPAQTALFIGGTTGTDTITIAPANTTGTTVTVSINGVLQAGGPFSPTGHLVVYGQAGNDVIQEVTKTINQQVVSVAIPALLFAGTGSCTLSVAGSSANNVLVGGAGSNRLTGGSGRDILIGGRGAGVLRAGGGGAILIGGQTVYDANVSALLSLLAEWGRTDRGTAARIEDLYGVGSGGLNGSYLLNAQAIIPNKAVDQLFAGPGEDWLWHSVGVTGSDQLWNLGPGDVSTLR
jgi:Ca2+-binding RTX toxin-like protein